MTKDDGCIQRSEDSRSRWPSPSRSPSAKGPYGVGREKGWDSENDRAPRFMRTETPLAVAATMSRKPSPSRSPVARKLGSLPKSSRGVSQGRNVPSPALRRSEKALL